MVVFCTYCGHSFTRDEHLERHILTHTNVKPFKCFTCHMSFARRDLLQRHYTVHGRDQNNEEGLPENHGMMLKAAGRTPIACHNCAKTKTKCDKKFPCSRCASKNLSCTMRPTRRTSKNPTVATAPAQPKGNTCSSEQSSAESNPQSVRSSPPPQQPSPQEECSDVEVANFTMAEMQACVNGSAAYFDAQQHSAIGSSGSFFPSLTSSSTPSPNASPFASVDVSAPALNDIINSVGSDNDQAVSPFFLDLQMQLDYPYDTLAPPDLMVSSMDFNFNCTSTVACNELLAVFPNLTNDIGTLQAPLSTIRNDSTISEPDFSSNKSSYYHSRHASISESMTADLPAVVAAQEGWTVFRCTPSIPPTSCPRTAKLNLERLEQSLRNHEGWSMWQPSWNEADLIIDSEMNIIPFQEGSRDKLLAITQTFLHKALEIHQEDASLSPPSCAGLNIGSSNFILLPPARVLECFIRAYGNSFEKFFPLVPRKTLDVNRLLECHKDKAASLLILMIISQGAMAMASLETRWLSGGLTEACRISLLDLIEKNISLSSDHTVLHSALLYIVQAAWSGDKWQMDISNGQRGMYMAMLKHSGIFEPCHKSKQSSYPNTPENQWSSWTGEENKSRLMYSWVMVDQDLSLFHDIAQLLSVTECGAPMPDSDEIWDSKSEGEWTDKFQKLYGNSAGCSVTSNDSRPPSLRNFFRQFLDNESISTDFEITAFHLRLLLHPLQSLVYQYRQLLSCFSQISVGHQRTNSVTAASARAQLDEVHTLLQRWRNLADEYLKTHPTCPMMQAALVIFHLINLNTLTDFAAIERLARREDTDGSSQQLAWIVSQCVSNEEGATFHCGQVIRIIRSMPRGIRPPWWPGALYRVGLILWTRGLVLECGNQMSPMLQNSMGTTSGTASIIAIDSLPPDHPTMTRYLSDKEGLPALTACDGTLVPMGSSSAMLSHVINVIDEGMSTRFSDGIRAKLNRVKLG